MIAIAEPVPPKVSVSILTWNQREYIAQAIDSALMQETDFPVEIRIGDDCSSDGTREILQDYQRRYPGRVFLNLQPSRPAGIPGRVNNMTNLASCRGDYIAMLDGDDYWTDPHKLARQVAILDAEPALGGVAHDAVVMKDGEPIGFVSQERGILNHRPGMASLRDVIIGPPVLASTFLFRAAHIRPFPGWFPEIPAGDWGVIALVAAGGDIRVLDTPMAVYRQHGQSVLATVKRQSPLTRHLWHHQSLIMIAQNFATGHETRQFRARMARSRMALHLIEWNIGRMIRHFPALVIHDTGNLLNHARVFSRRLRDKRTR